jgi:hypothetical protein
MFFLTDEFRDLQKYHQDIQDGSVLAWPTDHTKPDLKIGKKKIKFTIEAHLLKETEHGRTVRLTWMEFLKRAQRQQRRYTRKERQAEGRKMESGYDHIEEDHYSGHDEL